MDKRMALHPLMCVSILICICLCVCVCVLCHVHMYVRHSGPEQSSDSGRTAARWCLPGGADGDPACQSPGAPTRLPFTWSHLVSSKSGRVLFIRSQCLCTDVWSCGVLHPFPLMRVSVSVSAARTSLVQEINQDKVKNKTAVSITKKPHSVFKAVLFSII